MVDNIRRIVGPRSTPTSSAVVFTGAPNFKYIIDTIVVCNTSSGPRTFGVGINGSSPSTAYSIFAFQPIAPQTTDTYYPDAVLVGAETLEAVSNGTEVTVTVNAEEIAFTS